MPGRFKGHSLAQFSEPFKVKINAIPVESAFVITYHKLREYMLTLFRHANVHQNIGVYGNAYINIFYTRAYPYDDIVLTPFLLPPL